jgi:alkylation response protein AidB-like acyl-CoA dehydrogenase
MLESPVIDSSCLVAEFRAWLSGVLPAEWCRRAFPSINPPGEEDEEGVDISREWQRVLYEAGWAAPGLPVGYGGRGLDLAGQLAVADELARARAPVPIGFHGLGLLAPTLTAHGTEEQRRHFLPGILSGDEVWCQGYSEPDSGSDLASLRTSARRDGDVYIVNGHKVWTSFGKRATWCFLLARTGPPESKHDGISFFVVSMDSPGIEWRPIVDVTGSEAFGQLYLDHLAIPANQMIGAEGAGWRVAMSSLAHERLLASNIAHMRARYDALIRLARDRRASAVERDRVAAIGARLVGLEGLQSAALRMEMQGDRRFAVWASMVKLGGTVLRQDIAETSMRILGVPATTASRYGCPVDATDEAAVWSHELLDSRACTIYAGSSEIQRNIIGERGLGLPKDL